MKKYDTYKDSGFEWIGDIPNHWKVIRLKHKGEVIIGLSYNPDNVVDEDNGTLVLRSSNIQNGKLSLNDNVYVDSLISEKLRTKKGDILICSRNGSRNLIGKNCLITPEVEGKTWGVFMSLYRSKNPYFLYWILNSPIFESQSGLYLTSTINQLTVSTLENLVVPFTEDEVEQNQIVKYLDEKTTIIDTIVDKTQQKIKTLKELRSSLINKVITKGLDPNVEMKDSGVEWICEIPKKWNFVRIGYVSELLTGNPWKSDLFDYDDGIKIVRGENVSEGFFRWGDRTRFWNQEIVKGDTYFLNSGDIIVSMDGSKVGKNYVLIKDQDLPLLLHQRMCRIRVNPTILSEFLSYLIGSEMFRYYIDISKTDPMIPHITQKDISDFFIPLPNTQEQQNIVYYLNEQTQLIDTSIQKEQLRIEKLKEYRQSLISDVVTGKIKVTDYE
jgi:type I restriction enzyme, S subunit